MTKKISLEALARMSHREFAAIQEEVSSHREETARGFEAVLNRMDAGFAQLGDDLKLLREDFQEHRRDSTAEILDLRARMGRVEKRLGLSKGRPGVAA